MRKVLILTVTAGGGHNACAEAVKNALEASGAAEVRIIDLLKRCSTKTNAWIADKGYNIAVSRLAGIYDRFFDYYLKAPSENRYGCAAQSVALSAVRGLMREILSFKPDVIYTTHFYGAIAITDLKLVYKLPCVTVASVLDYLNSPFWEAGVGADYLTLPNEDFTDEFLFEGYEKSQLIPLGRPVDGRTLEAKDKTQARADLGLKADSFTVLIMFGGGHWRGSFKIFKSVVNALKGTQAQIVIINGKDKKSFKKIAKMQPCDGLEILNVGYTKDVPAYLFSADIFIGKCGGGTATEAINAGIPMLIYEKIPAQEKYNLEYLKQKSVALSFKNATELKERLSFLMNNTDAVDAMKEQMLKLKKNAVSTLSELIISQPKADYSAFNIKVKRVKSEVRTALKYADFNERRRDD